MGEKRSDPYLTPDELAKVLAVKVSWVYTQIAAGAIPVVRVGRYVRFDWPTVERWLSEGRQEPESA